MQIVDFSSDWPSPPALYGKGVLTYLPKKGHSKVAVLTAAHRQMMDANHIPYGLIYEDIDAGWMRNGYDFGTDRATWALERAHDLGVPEDHIIYFADDAQHVGIELVQVYNTLRGIRDVAGPRVGLYGFRSTLNYMWGRGLAHKYWLTGSKPNQDTVDFFPLSLYQHNTDNITLQGQNGSIVVCDLNTAYDAHWNLIKGAAPMATLDDGDRAWIAAQLNAQRDLINHDFAIAINGDQGEDPGHQSNLRQLRDDIAALRAALNV